MERTYIKFFISLLAICLLIPLSATAGSKQLMTIQKAKDMARRAIVESVVGLKIRSNALWANRPSDYYSIQSKVAAAVKGIEFERVQYDKQKDIAKVTASIKVGSVENIIGKQVDFGDMVIKRTAFATSTPAYMDSLNALRAAELNAYDEMAKMIVGQKIASETKVKNFVLESDQVRTKVLAAIWGSEVKEFGWTDDGNAFVTLRLNARWVKDVMDQQIKYTQDNYIEVTGYGSPVDDMEEAISTGGSSENLVRRKSSVEQTSFDIPGPGSDLKAAPEAMEEEATQPETGGSAVIR